jgi:RNA polymerase sigma-70 factor (ECF subfamily)
MISDQNKDQLLKKLFDKYFAHLVIFSKQIVRDRIIAEDIVQEVFLGLWEKDKLKIGSINFLYRCVKNSSINYLHSKDGKIHKVSDSIILDVKDELSSFDDEIEKMKELELLYSAIEELPPQCKNVLKKVYLNNQKYADVAEELNISLNTVKTHMYKAFKLLRQKFSVTSLLCFSTFFKMLG